MNPDILYIKNRMFDPSRPKGYGEKDAEEVRRVHRLLPSYASTRLVSCSSTAERLGLGGLYVKDESTRFGLKAFKGLGGFYAMFVLLCRRFGLDEKRAELSELLSEPLAGKVRALTFVTATDGNHGKGISWAAGLFGCGAEILMPRGTAPARVRAAREAGTGRVSVTDLDYDGCVGEAARLARENGWILIQDTSWEGYEEIPGLIMKGYLTMLYETLEEMRELHVRPTHVILQAGVGAMAAAMTAGLVNAFSENAPVIVCAEPKEAACVFESMAAADGEPHTAAGSGETIMAGLNCGTPCSLAWEILKRNAAGAFACEDLVAREGMRLLAREGIVSGESGAVGAGLVAGLMEGPEYGPLRRELGLGPESVVLLFSTEGDTDPDGWRDTVAGGCS